MKCPVCDRSLAPTLSICPSCGAMMNDTVREELETLIVRRAPVQTPIPPAPRASIPAPTVGPGAPVKKVLDPPLAPPPKRVVTSGLVAPKTSPTLVGFQHKDPPVPEWRLQMQNAVQQRRGGSAAVSTSGAAAAVAVAVEAAPRAVPVSQPAPQPKIDDPRIAAAMRRIEDSRREFAEAKPTVKRPAAPAKSAPARSFPFDVVSNPAPAVGATSVTPAPVRPSAAVFETPASFTPPRPKLVFPEPQAELKRDTNKLPPIPMPSGPLPEPVAKKAEAETGSEEIEIGRIMIKGDTIHITADVETEEYSDDIEDLAPFSMRFGAGLFDMIIAVFSTMILLSPLAFTNSNWFSPSSMLIFVGSIALVTFVYMTVCLGFFGKTMGMRLFSLELVDASENEYPTLRQAAVNSSVFLMSLVFAGTGFLTVFFNEERRALHDLLSGTILVREF